MQQSSQINPVSNQTFKKMTSAEKFCLKWNDFQVNIANSFHDLREDLDFCDVTLVCEGDNQVQAHKVILSACSPFFNSMLRKNKHSHPIIYMRGLKANDLLAVVDFIYHGEANIYQEDLDGFLTLADELKLKGLTGSNNKMEESQNITPDKKPKKSPKKELSEKSTVAVDEYYENSMENPEVEIADFGKTIVSVDPKNEDLKAKIESMMERDVSGKWRCKMCETVPKDKTNMGRHAETHIEGVSYPCIICGKISRSGMAFSKHMSRNHRI